MRRKGDKQTALAFALGILGIFVVTTPLMPVGVKLALIVALIVIYVVVVEGVK